MRTSSISAFGWCVLSAAVGACSPAPPVDQTSSCAEVGPGFRCHYSSTALSTEHGDRDVHFALPLAGDDGPPASGWPVVLAFQGSGFPAELYFSSDPNMAFGGEHQGLTTRALLEAGFAVIAPEAQQNGNQYWDSNLVHRNFNWEGTPDHALMLALFTLIEGGHFGHLDPERLFAMGISSGGYMTSRMAVSYPGRFSRLAIVSASYATCGGVYCPLPDMPDDHPPTLFIHGEADLISPFDAMMGYKHALDDEGVRAEVMSEPGRGHGWLEGSDARVLEFFDPGR